MHKGPYTPRTSFMHPAPTITPQPSCPPIHATSPPPFGSLDRNSLTAWRLSGPRLMAPVIENVALLAEAAEAAAVGRYGVLPDSDAASDAQDPGPGPEGEVAGAGRGSLPVPPAYTLLIILTNGPPQDIKVGRGVGGGVEGGVVGGAQDIKVGSGVGGGEVLGIQRSESLAAAAMFDQRM